MDNNLTELYLEKPKIEDELKAIKMMKKWREYGGRTNPGLLRLLIDNYSDWLNVINSKSNMENNEEVPQTLYFLKNSQCTILGAVSLRHYLNHTNILDGGHVGYGICPEFRGKGYGNLILQLAVDKLVSMGINKILVTCDSDNEISQKVITYNNGILENQVHDEDGILVNRYWIKKAEKSMID